MYHYGFEMIGGEKNHRILCDYYFINLPTAINFALLGDLQVQTGVAGKCSDSDAPLMHL